MLVLGDMFLEILWSDLFNDGCPFRVLRTSLESSYRDLVALYFKDFNLVYGKVYRLWINLLADGLVFETHFLPDVLTLGEDLVELSSEVIHVVFK